jgi:hypothetical protein
VGLGNENRIQGAVGVGCLAALTQIATKRRRKRRRRRRRRRRKRTTTRTKRAYGGQ